MAADDKVRPLPHNVVWVNAVIFHDPFATIVRRPECKFWRGDVAAVMQRNPAKNADESAPRARAHDGPNFLAMKEPREGVASGARNLVDDHHLRPINRDGRPRSVLAFARRERGEKLTAELFRVEVRNLSAGIVALIDDDAVLIELRGELLVERDDAGEGSVRHVHIADAAAGGLRDLAAVLLRPRAAARTRLPPARPSPALRRASRRRPRKV